MGGQNPTFTKATSSLYSNVPWFSRVAASKEYYNYNVTTCYCPCQAQAFCLVYIKPQSPDTPTPMKVHWNPLLTYLTIIGLWFNLHTNILPCDIVTKGYISLITWIRQDSPRSGVDMETGNSIDFPWGVVWWFLRVKIIKSFCLWIIIFHFCNLILGF